MVVELFAGGVENTLGITCTTLCFMGLIVLAVNDFRIKLVDDPGVRARNEPILVGDLDKFPAGGLPRLPVFDTFCLVLIPREGRALFQFE